MISFSRRIFLSSLAASAFLGTEALGASPTPVRIGILKFGTASWELDVIRQHGLDRKHQVAIEPVDFAANQATQVALQSGRVDMILADWLWVARQRADGADWTFAPFSTSVGAVVAPSGSPVASVRGLPGKRLGIAGSPLDKSWLILRAYAQRKLGIDLDQTANKSFGAPPLLLEQAKAGQLDAMLTFWPFAAKAEAAGMKRVLGVEEAVRELGIGAPVPFVGYVFSRGWAGKNRAALDGYFAAAHDAQQMLATSDDEWRRIAPLTGARNDDELAQLKAAYRAGLIRHWGEPEQQAAASLYKILAEIGGPALVGTAQTIPPGTFW